MEPKNSLTTMVCFHDLLGYGEMIALSGGNLDSAVGKLAHERINLLRNTVSNIKSHFPENAILFQINDAAVIVCDINYQIDSMHIDSQSIHSSPPTIDSSLTALRFINGSANLHQSSLNAEHDNKIGPGGRTFIILGKRWPINEYKSDGINDIPTLQANLAFAEAYIADNLGKKAGFSQRIWENIYINDYMEHLLSTSKIVIPDQISLLKTIRPTDNFPKNIMTPDTAPIEVEIFHRKRKFFSIMSHYAKDISSILNQNDKGQ